MPWAKELLRLNQGKSDLQSAIEVRARTATEGSFEHRRLLQFLGWKAFEQHHPLSALSTNIIAGIQDTIIITVKGIAAGMQNTG